MTQLIPSFNLTRQYEYIGKELQEAANNVLSSGQYILGQEVANFENEIAQYLEIDEAVGVASGSDALILALLALGVGKGDEVLTTTFSFFATASCVDMLGAKPVFVDSRMDTYNLDEKQIEKLITKKTKAIIVVHLYGQPSNMDAIMRIAKKHNIKVIEDAAQAIGSTYKGKMVGTIGDIGTYSFFPTKNLGCAGDGGLVVSKHKDISAKLRKLRTHGSVKKYIHDTVGRNSRLDALQAAILRVKLKYLPAWTRRRQEIAQLYTNELANVAQITIPHIDTNTTHVFHQYTIRCEDRDKLRAFLTSKGIGSQVYYPVPLNDQTCFTHHKQAKKCPNALALTKQVLSLPIFPELKDSGVLFVVNAIKEFYSQ